MLLDAKSAMKSICPWYTLVVFQLSVDLKLFLSTASSRLPKNTNSFVLNTNGFGTRLSKSYLHRFCKAVNSFTMFLLISISLAKGGFAISRVIRYRKHLMGLQSKIQIFHFREISWQNETERGHTSTSMNWSLTSVHKRLEAYIPVLVVFCDVMS